MAGVLSQSQIDKLLSGLASGGEEAEIKPTTGKDKAKVYDFKSPKKFTKEQLKTQESLYENFARILSSYFTSLLRVFCEIEVTQIEEQRFFEYNNALPDNGILSTYELQAKNNKIEEVPIIFNMSNSICFYLIDKLLGGPGTGWNYNRDFTDIEVAIIENILKKVENPLQDCWSKYIELDCSLQAIETNPRLVQICAPEDIVLIVLLEVKMKEMSGTISICAPAINLVELMESFTSKFMRFSKRQLQDPQVKRNTIFSSIKKTDLELTAVLDEIEIDLYDLMQMQVGDIVPLNKKTDDFITLKVDNKPWFNAKLGETKMKKAVKINSIIEKGVDKQ